MGKKETLIFVLAILFLNKASAIEVYVNPINDVVAIELNVPARYNVTIKNDLNSGQNFSIYSLVDLELRPEQIFVEANSEKSFILEALPKKRTEGYKKYDFYVRSEANYMVLAESSIIMKVLPLEKILSIDIPTELSRDDKTIILNLKNKENIRLVFPFTINSELFDFSSEATLEKETKNFSIQVDLSKKHAGTYDIFFTARFQEYSFKKTIPVVLQEVSKIIEFKEKRWHFFGYTNIITKKNDGNARKVITIELPLSRIENAFTSFNIQPSEKVREKDKVVARWYRELQPGESFTVEARTDYTILAVVIIVIAAALIFYLMFFTKKVLIKKKAIKLKTKRDEFAAKIILVAKNIGTKEIKNVRLVDNLPVTTKLYEKFGPVRPDKIERTKLEWNFATLLPGEEIVTSYIIYSKVGMTHVELPEALLSYYDEKNKHHTVKSGKVIVL
ncbi:MAG: hypothetical protein NZ889_02030 [Candidatus Pacearchaeota archaeon]|nr:hypothetical protein [Candidatus Pacearchaeota archaeon]